MRYIIILASLLSVQCAGGSGSALVGPDPVAVPMTESVPAPVPVTCTETYYPPEVRFAGGNTWIRTPARIETVCSDGTKTVRYL